MCNNCTTKILKYRIKFLYKKFFLWEAFFIMHKKIFISVLSLVILALSCCASSANEFIVNLESGSDSGSLYAAIMEANRLQGNGHVINFAATIEKIKLPGEVPIRAGIEIYGDGITIEGSGTTGLFKITEGNVLFDKITFTGGNETDCGGAVEIKGENASVEFRNCTFFNNRAGLYGGAVCITKTANSTTQIPAVFKNCTIAGNYAREGGGIAIRDGIVSLNLSIVAGNYAGNNSGDIFGETTGFLTGKSNVAGSVNVNQQTTDVFSYVNQLAKDIFVTNSNGNLALETVNGVQVLRLAGNSPAKDILLTQESYALDDDEIGNPRPQLDGYDAGAFEAVPIEVISIDVRAMPYTQINTSDKLLLNVYPEDSSVNSSVYPSGIEWVVSVPGILSVDKDGNARAIGQGTAYVTAIFHGWDSNGNPKEVRSNPVEIHTGVEPRQNMLADIKYIDDYSIPVNYSVVITPEVTLSMNGYNVNGIKAGRDYSLSAVVLNGSEFLSTQVISNDSVILTAYDSVGSSDVRIVASPLPSGDSDSTTFNVEIVKDGNQTNSSVKKAGHNGGGCQMGFGLTGIALIIFLSKKSGKKF